MSEDDFREDMSLVEAALRTASDTRVFRTGHGVRREIGAVAEGLFGQRPVLVVADTNTFEAAGRDVVDGIRRDGHAVVEPFVFPERDLHAEYGHVEAIETALASSDAVAVAVGSGTINDLTKLASHCVGRPYIVVATAASMDGYSAFGASVSRDGWKQTFACPAPVGVFADLEVIESAPVGMNASGYADLAAKVVAGADWLVAETLISERIDQTAWAMVHYRMADWLEGAKGIRRGDGDSIRGLIIGLVVSGLAMQWTKSSRIASGAEHQFSHLWDMQGHEHLGRVPSHGFKVGIGSLASLALYEQILEEPFDELDVEGLVKAWPSIECLEVFVGESFDRSALAGKALEETHAKYPSEGEIRQQLTRLRQGWKQLRRRLREQLPGFDELAQRLGEAGCPTVPEQIGIGRDRLRGSYRQACCIRRRITVHDLADRTQTMGPALVAMFGEGGRWGVAAPA